MIRLRLPQLPKTFLSHVSAPPRGLCPTVEDGLRSGNLFLGRAGIQTARLDAECLLAHSLSWPRWRLLSEGGRRLTPEEFRAYLSLLHRRELREPVAYLIGTKEFWSLPLAVSAEVLIPRPETETLVETALSLLGVENPPGSPNGALLSRARPLPMGLESTHPSLIDLCTGSGAVAIALARELPAVAIVATDISRAALRIARQNAEAHGVADRITFVRGNLWRALEGQTSRVQADLVVSNPPYIPTHVLPTLMPEIRWEPRSALDGGWDGLTFHRAIIAGALPHMRPGGFLLLEIGADQAAPVSDILETSGSFERIRVLPDLAGRDRVIAARRRNN